MAKLISTPPGIPSWYNGIAQLQRQSALLSSPIAPLRLQTRISEQIQTGSFSALAAASYRFEALSAKKSLSFPDCQI